MTEYIIVLITAGSTDEAEKISRGLVERRLAACVNIIPTVRSLFHWEGEVSDEKETMLVVKSRRGLFEDIVLCVKALHSYDVPEILALPVLSGSEAYLRWIEEETG